MNSKRPDWISLVEAGYDLRGSDSDWLGRLLTHAQPLLDGEAGPMAWTYHCTPVSFDVCDLSHSFSKALAVIARAAHVRGLAAPSDNAAQGGIAPAAAGPPRLPAMQRIALRPMVGFAMDMQVINCPAAAGLGLSIAVLVQAAYEPPPLQQRRWPQLIAHLGAARRLRAMARQLSPGSMPVEAVLDASGKVHDLQGPAQDAEARENLRQAVRRIERSRSAAGRRHTDEALAHWEGLVDGRWSLVDRFDADGRRFVVAIKNSPACPDPRGLTRRERQVAEFVGLGKASKEIAYAFGVSEAAITNCTARAQQKLGLSSRAELVGFFAPNGLRRQLAQLAVADDTLLVGACPLIDEACIARLSEAERQVVAHLVAGSTNSDIARRRGSSERTVANQLQSIFRKLRVRSRAELIVRLQAAPR